MTSTESRRLHDTADRLTDGRFGMLVGGAVVPAVDGATYDLFAPGTGSVVQQAPAAGRADVDDAVRAALEAHAGWRDLGLEERIGRVRRVLAMIEDHAEEFALLDAVDCGNPVSASRADVGVGLALVEQAVGWARAIRSEVIPGRPDHLHYTVREPYGVVARIAPYNHPFLVAARTLVPMLVGNTVVLKAPDQAPLSSLRFGELVADLLPPGVLNVVSGSGADAGDALVRHPDVWRIAFTGSVSTGLTIQRAAAGDRVKNVSLELGGKNPMLVYPDADIERAALGAVTGMNFRASAGQSCGSNSRVLVHSSVADRFVDLLVKEISAIRVGDPLDPATEMGPMVSEEHQRRVLGAVERAAAQGASVVAGGGRPAGSETGYFVEPTVLTGVRQHHDVARQEIFGPVVSILTWEDEDEAVEMANDVEYGLTASVWTSDVGHAHRVVRRLDAGHTWINTSGSHYPGVPFGGMKNSGGGREEDADELLTYLQTKAVNVRLE